MTRINLLPVRASKKKETARQQLSILIISMVGVLVVGISIYATALAKIKATKEQILRSEVELKALKSKIGEIDNIKKLQAEVKKKLDVLAQLRKDKSGPANRLARLAESVPDKLWLTKYAENGPAVSIAGTAVNEELIAEFMRRLQATGIFYNVELTVSEQKELAGIKVKNFDITYALSMPKPEAPKPGKK